mgnify:CR=1 FL=1
MKIFIPTKDVSELSLVSEQLGRSAYFYIYDTKTEEGVFYQNLYLKESHGAGVKVVEFILSHNVDYLITPRVGEKSMDLLMESNLKIYRSNGKVVKEVIKDLMNDSLEELI